MIDVYGLKNCDTCRKAIKWLEAESIEHRFHDVRAEPLSADTLGAWLAELGSDALVNRRGTTWRKLPEAATASLDDAGTVKLLLEHPAVMKRPVFDLGDRRIVGFKAPEQAALQAAGK